LFKEFTKELNPEPKINVNRLKNMVKRQPKQSDIINKTVHELPVTDISSQVGANLRRSERVKLNRTAQQVYKYELIKDFKGDEVVVQSLSGYIEKRFPNKYIEYMTGNFKAF
jgi:hypothetical protein